MDITPQCVVALTWTLKDTLGEVLDELDSPMQLGKELRVDQWHWSMWAMKGS